MPLDYKNWLVSKSNPFNEMRHFSLNTEDMRFIDFYLARINPLDLNSRIVRLSVKDLYRIFDYSKNTSIDIAKLEHHAKKLLNQVVSIRTEKGFTAFNIFSYFEYLKDENGDWFLEINANDKMLPFFFDLKSNYLSYKFENIVKLSSKNQIRLYQILKQYEKIGNVNFTVKDLRELIGIKKKIIPIGINLTNQLLYLA